MRARTAILGAAVGVIVAVGAGAWWLYASRDALVKRAIEHYGPQYAGVSVTVKGVKLEPVDGRGAISGLEVGNPPGFSSSRALTLGEIRLSLDPRTLTAPVIHVRELVVDGPHINYERNDKGDNLTAIQRRLQSQVPKSRDGAKKAGGSGDPPDERRFLVDRVQVRNAKVSYAGAVTATLPDQQFRDLGKKTNGATAAEISEEILAQLRREAIAKAPAALEGLRDKAQDAAERLRGLVK